MPNPIPVFQFDMKKYQTSKITTAKLDGLMEFVLNSGAGKIGAIIAGIKILFIFAYLWARKSLIDNEKEIALQEYELSRINISRTSINDNLD